MATRSKSRQQLLVVVAALAIIAASVSSTLYFTGFFTGGAEGSGGPGYQNITFTDAFLECDSYTRERYASRLRTLAMDDHSSRYEDASKLYKIFLQLQMRRPPHSPEPEPYWVNCFVSASDGRIVQYQVGEGKDLPPPKPGTSEKGGAFGWR